MSQTWDVFVSHCHADEAIAKRITDALRAAGLRVYRAVDQVRTLSSITTEVLDALHHSKILLAYYSAEYPTRLACQRELADAYLAGAADGDPLRRLVVVNPERGFAHIQPRVLRDALLPRNPATDRGLAAVVLHARQKVEAVDTPLGAVGAQEPTWLSGRPPRSPEHFVGRWRELWTLHGALHADPGELTSPANGPVVVLSGPIGVGKTALAAEYAKRFGGSFDGLTWLSGHGKNARPDRRSSRPPEGPGVLWIVDDVRGRADELLPDDPRTACLLITRDARLADLGLAVAVDDLPETERQLLVDAYFDGPEADQLAHETAGSTGLCTELAKLAAETDTPYALRALHHPASDVLEPFGRELAAQAPDDTAFDVLRVLAAAAPVPLTLTAIADVLARADGQDRVTAFGPVQHAASELLARGALPGRPDADELHLPPAFAAAVRRVDEQPQRAERLRGLTVQRVAERAAPAMHLPTASRKWDDEELRVAHLIQTELVNRVPFRELRDGKGVLREAYESMYELFRLVRTVRAKHPRASRQATAGDRPGLGSIIERLLTEVFPPHLDTWHPLLADHEDQRPAGTGRLQHERAWERHDEARAELAALRYSVMEIAQELSTITGDRHGLTDR